MSLNLTALIGKLNDTSRKGLEAAAGLAVSRTHYEIELEHFLLKMLDAQGTDLEYVMKFSEIDRARFSAELTRGLDALKTGNARRPVLSPSVLDMFTEAWTIGSIDFGASRIRSGFAILAIASNDELKRAMAETSKEFKKISADALRKDFLAIVSGSREDGESGATEDRTAGARPSGGKMPNLDQYTLDLTAAARAGKIDPVLGRDFEIRQIIDILQRRRQNNPILTGEAGVGKTAVVEGFALRVAQGDVPPPLRNVSVRSLDLALLQAGAGVKGEFENRLKSLIEEVKSSPTPIILFIDEAHTMIGAGGQAGQNDAANLLKPALARGELRTIAATTWSEYKKYFEKDAALARRFQVVKVEEPTETQCMVMLRGIVPALEKHHDVRILDEGLEAAVRLSHRYLAGRQLPDKAVSVLDTACARLSLGQNATPPAIEDSVRLLDDLAVQERILQRESAAGANHAERLETLAARRSEAGKQLEAGRARWDREGALVKRIREIRLQLETGPTPAAVSDQATAAQPALDPEALRGELRTLTAELAAAQGESPLMGVCVDAQTVGEVISAWTGIPAGKMLRNEISTVLELHSHLGRRIVGQGHALEAVSQRIQT
ncbi:MAG: AAA family ATPase, partial [Acidobacteriota bacterium]|nr:AAA family ATPase [Acidobacteriota bacterium]